MPIGLYTREVLKRLGMLRVLRKAVSQEPDVKGIVGKVAFGEADAGFVYATDVRAASSRADRDPVTAALAADGSIRDRGREEHDNRAAALEFVADLLGAEGGASCSAPASASREKRCSASALAVATARRTRLPASADRRDLPPRSRPGELLDGMTSAAAVDALVVTLEDDARRERALPRSSGRRPRT